MTSVGLTWRAGLVVHPRAFVHGIRESKRRERHGGKQRMRADDSTRVNPIWKTLSHQSGHHSGHTTLVTDYHTALVTALVALQGPRRHAPLLMRTCASKVARTQGHACRLGKGGTTSRSFEDCFTASSVFGLARNLLRHKKTDLPACVASYLSRSCPLS